MILLVGGQGRLAKKKEKGGLSLSFMVSEGLRKGFECGEGK